MKFSVCFARFPFGATDHPDTTDWLVETVLKAKSDPRIEAIFHKRYDDTPITMTRNRCVLDAKKSGVDFLLMIDNDMCPDIPTAGPAKPFWDSSLEWMIENGPCLVAAPYCGPPPHENIYVFRWEDYQTDNPNPDMKLDQFTRTEAAQMAGISQVGALPTGLILIDMRVFDALKPPYFYYEWKDENQAQKASTEDVTFTRDLSLQGVPVYCNWDAWAGHWKRKRVDKPQVLHIDHIRKKFVDAVKEGVDSRERKLDMPARKIKVLRSPEVNGEACDVEAVQRG